MGDEAAAMGETVVGVIGIALGGFMLYKIIKAVAVMIREAEGADDSDGRDK